jgi:hypothetical protein
MNVALPLFVSIANYLATIPFCLTFFRLYAVFFESDTYHFFNK